MEKAKKHQTISYIIYWIVALLALITILYLYFTHINSNDKTSVTKWGQIGDFIGGIIGSYIAILNLIVFVILTRRLSKIQELGTKQSISIQQKIVISQLRSGAIKEFSELLTKYYEYLDSFGNYSIQDINKVSHLILTFIETNDHLFPTINNDTKELIALIRKIYHHITKLNVISNRDEVFKLVDDYWTQKSKVLSTLQRMTIQELSSE